MYECRCDGRLKTKTEESTRLAYTGLVVELEHLKMKTRLIDETFASVSALIFFFSHPVETGVSAAISFFTLFQKSLSCSRR